MYNPFSLLNTFCSNKFKDYWFETGTPTLLVNVMKQTSFDITTQLMRLNQNLWIAADEVRSPVLIVHGEKAHSRYFGEEAFTKLTDGKYAANKHLLIVPGATHCDLYDGGEGNFIPWNDIIGFLKANLQRYAQTLTDMTTSQSLTPRQLSLAECACLEAVSFEQ